MSGSKGLQRYVPRILQDSGMIASSEVAHYTHLKLVQYVKADDIDAALRRAKAEGMREAGKIARANAELLRPPSRQFELNMVNKAKSEEAGMIADELDARAAQIEEGE